MELKHMYSYIAVAELLSFSRAAERLYISQPALSQRIAELEKELSVRLLIRNRHKVVLTEAGKLFLHHCRDITSRIETISGQLRQAEHLDSIITPLRIGLTANSVSSGWFSLCLARAISDMERNHPSQRAVITVIDFENISPSSLSSDFDLCISVHHSAQSPHESLCMDTLYTDSLCLVISKDHPLNTPGSTCKSILQSVDLLMLDNNEGMQYQMSRLLAEMNVSPLIRYLNSESLSMLQVLSGKGCIIYPKRTALSCENSACLDIYDIDSPHTGLYYLAFSGRYNTNPLVPMFCHSLRDICRA